MTLNNEALRLIGLAFRAGKVRSGEFQVEESVKCERAKLCIVARDASDTSKKDISDMCSFRGIDIIEADCSKDELGHSIGRDERSSLTIEDDGFAKHILEKIKGGNACGK